MNIELRPSRLLLAGGGSAHVLAGIAVATCSLSLWIKVGLIAGIALALVRFGQQYGYQQGRSFITRIERLTGGWRLETGDGMVHRARLTGGYAHPLIVILNFRLESTGQWSLALWPDSADPDALRQLRVWLRIQQGRDESAPP